MHGTTTVMGNTTVATMIDKDTKDEQDSDSSNNPYDDNDDTESIYYTPPTGDGDYEKKNVDH